MEVNRAAADRLLTCTRSVRQRLDLSRPVDLALVHECLTIAQQAPSSGAGADQRWIVVTDRMIRTRLGEIYRRACERLPGRPADDRPVTAQEASERILAELLGLPRHIGQAGMVATAHTVGDTFRPARGVAQAGKDPPAGNGGHSSLRYGG